MQDRSDPGLFPVRRNEFGWPADVIRIGHNSDASGAVAHAEKQVEVRITDDDHFL
jgi:hypothetical protein